MKRKNRQTSEGSTNETDEDGIVSGVDESLASEDDEKEMDFDESENFADESSASDSDGNAGWADAMAKVLHSSMKSSKFILSKAKKDADIKPTEKKVELVDESGKIVEEKPKQSKSYSEKRKEMLERQRLKAEWEAMSRVKPDITNKDRERELVRIATRGVVHLFNTVEKHQKTSTSTKKNSQKEKKISVVKGNFMDILKEYSKKDEKIQEDPLVKKIKQEETWSILKDDFMMGAEMKDWDKDDENT